jgi:hypothetical protein
VQSNVLIFSTIISANLQLLISRLEHEGYRRDNNTKLGGEGDSEGHCVLQEEGTRFSYEASAPLVAMVQVYLREGNALGSE